MSRYISGIAKTAGSTPANRSIAQMFGTTPFMLDNGDGDTRRVQNVIELEFDSDFDITAEQLRFSDASGDDANEILNDIINYSYQGDMQNVTIQLMRNNFADQVSVVTFAELGTSATENNPFEDITLNDIMDGLISRLSFPYFERGGRKIFTQTPSIQLVDDLSGLRIQLPAANQRQEDLIIFIEPDSELPYSDEVFNFNEGQGPNFTDSENNAIMELDSTTGIDSEQTITAAGAGAYQFPSFDSEEITGADFVAAGIFPAGGSKTYRPTDADRREYNRDLMVVINNLLTVGGRLYNAYQRAGLVNGTDELALVPLSRENPAAAGNLLLTNFMGPLAGGSTVFTEIEATHLFAVRNMTTGRYVGRSGAGGGATAPFTDLGQFGFRPAGEAHLNLAWNAIGVSIIDNEDHANFEAYVITPDSDTFATPTGHTGLTQLNTGDRTLASLETQLTAMYAAFGQTVTYRWENHPTVTSNGNPVRMRILSATDDETGFVTNVGDANGNAAVYSDPFRYTRRRRSTNAVSNRAFTDGGTGVRYSGGAGTLNATQVLNPTRTNAQYRVDGDVFVDLDSEGLSDSDRTVVVSFHPENDAANKTRFEYVIPLNVTTRQQVIDGFETAFDAYAVTQVDSDGNPDSEFPQAHQLGSLIHIGAERGERVVVIDSEDAYYECLPFDVIVSSADYQFGGSGGMSAAEDSEDNLLFNNLDFMPRRIASIHAVSDNVYIEEHDSELSTDPINTFRVGKGQWDFSELGGLPINPETMRLRVIGPSSFNVYLELRR